ncbi:MULTISPECIES: glycosyltransferase 87 family protein [unclassified Nonomuraea]|uniref:glycosyltransferase 87 family protein n=1 Tax=unclassified Nonomuraea TaxID=2593643 RepID=UPI0033EF1E89
MTRGEVRVIRRQWWAWAVVALVVAAAAAPLVHTWLTNPDDQRLVDLDVYRTGGQMLLDGRPVYDFFTPAPQLLPFTYPPIAAMLAVALAEMSWGTAQWVWTAGIFAALAVTVWFAFRQALRAYVPWVFGLLMVACTYLMPIRDQVRFGQVDILLVALCLVDCLARRPWLPRGFLVGLATAVKLTPGVFLIYFLVTKQWRTFFMAAFVAAMLTVLPFVVIPQDASAFWFSALLDPERLGANTATTNQSIRGMLLRLYMPESLTFVIWAVIVAAVAWYGFRAARAAYQAKDELTAVALTSLMAVLLSPVAWIHHLAWVVVVLGAIAGDGRDPVRLRVAAGVWLFYVVPVPWWGVSLIAAGIPGVSLVLGKIVQDGFGLGALVLVWLLASWLPKRRQAA